MIKVFQTSCLLFNRIFFEHLIYNKSAGHKKLRSARLLSG